MAPSGSLENKAETSGTTNFVNNDTLNGIPGTVPPVTPDVPTDGSKRKPDPPQATTERACKVARVAQYKTEETDSDDEMGDADSHSKDDGSQYEDSDGTKSEDEDDECPDGHINKTDAQKPKSTRWYIKNPQEFFARKLHRQHEKEQQRQSKGLSQRSAKGAPPSDEEFEEMMTELISNPLSSVATDRTPTNCDDINEKSNRKKLALIKKAIRKTEGEPPQTLKDREQSTKDFQDLSESVYCFGHNAMKPEGNSWRYKEMQTALRPVQLAAAKWMLERECTPGRPLGGILALGTGLGKTIISFACILGNRPSKEDLQTYAKATLVVVQSRDDAVRWARQVEKHCNEKWADDTTIYDSTGKFSRPSSSSRRTIVIATYQQVRDQYPNPRNQTKRGTGRRRKANASNTPGHLFCVHWFRVILDEAHKITKETTSNYLACLALKGKYRWTLTATPIANTAREFFPLLKFVGCDGMESSRSFREQYMNMSGSRVNSHFRDLVTRVMYRRTWKHTFLGWRLDDLPGYKTYDIHVELSLEEKILAKALDVHFGKRQSDSEEDDEDCVADSPTGKTEKGASDIVKRRQFISHFFNVENLLRASFSLEQITDLQSKLHALGDTVPLIDQMLANQTTKDAMEQYEVGIQHVRDRNDNVYGGAFDVGALLSLIADEQRAKICSKCVRCNADMNDPLVVPTLLEQCEHAYCEVCFSEENRIKLEFKVYPDCLGPGCGKPMKAKLNFETLRHVARQAKHQKLKEPGRDSMGNSVNLKGSGEVKSGDFFVACALRKDKYPLPPSTKLTAAMAIIATWLSEAPGDKIVVFTQFVATAKLLGLMLGGANVGFLYLVGDMGGERRQRAIDAFTAGKVVLKDGNTVVPHVLVATLQSGGEGKDFQIANRVILIDIWWNHVLEDQAFGRVLRIGQTKICHLVRIIAASGMDDRVTELQRLKSAEVNHALQANSHEDESFDSPVDVSDIADLLEEEKEKPKKGKGAPRGAKPGGRGRLSKKKN
ncbi:hypothetical protein JDV02_003207 [Purpureocillium takamizusanense]|uniref:Uncharacterized protein n=1 Tax=Purpureocillium takamizusanense TaxID=2060973 RepID=A0A9Q8V881_9HYPO|nr:uncharacterized protein JDV02_003207 [Purpureocillium takamizusanense]UNI16805.1 hypothetical protein JDV02_003207 [Purpureocillium takamizusanense]